MRPFSQNPAAAYRKVDLDARIEASGGDDLTRICLEEAVAALRQAELACASGGTAARDPLSRAHGITLWLCRGVASDNPLRAALVQFYGGLAAQIRRNMTQPILAEIVTVRGDLNDLLQAAQSVRTSGSVSDSIPEAA